MATVFLVLISTNAYGGWGAPDLASPEIRKKTYIETTSSKANDAFKRASSWFAKTFVDSKEAIRLKDEKENRIVAKGNTACDVLKLGSGFAEDQRVHFSLTFEAKDNRSRIIFEDVTAMGGGAYDSGSRPSNQEEMDKVISSCLDPLKSDIMNTINTDDNW